MPIFTVKIFRSNPRYHRLFANNFDFNNYPLKLQPAHLRRQPLAAAKPVGIRHDAEAEQPKATSVVAEQQQKLHAQKERSTTAKTTFSGEEAESAVHLDSKDVAVEGAFLG